MKWRKYAILLGILGAGWLLLRKFWTKPQSTSPQPVTPNPVNQTSPVNTPAPSNELLNPAQTAFVQPQNACGTLVTWQIKYGNTRSVDSEIYNSTTSFMSSAFVTLSQRINNIGSNNDAGILRKLPASVPRSRQNHNLLENNVRIVLRRIIVSQARHETCNYLSRLANEQNNFFGMGCALTRQNMQQGCNRNFANYTSLQQSVMDLDLWFSARTLDFRLDLLRDMALALYTNGAFNITLAGADAAINVYCDYIRNKSPFAYYTDTLERYSNGVRAAYRRAYI